MSCEVIPNEAKRIEESVYFKISWFDKLISRFARNDTYLLMNFNNLTQSSYSLRKILRETLRSPVLEE
jgi:hypothetical protein